MQEITENISKKLTHKYDIKTTENIFKGLVKCGNCGKNLYRFKNYIKDKMNKIYVYYHFKYKSEQKLLYLNNI